MNEITRMLDALADKAEGPNRLPYIGQLANLREALEHYEQPCPFVVGDVITPRKNSTYCWAGEPHIVCEVNDQPHPRWDGGPGNQSYGSMLNVRVLVMVASGTVAAFWAESWQFEPWTEEAA